MTSLFRPGRGIIAPLLILGTTLGTILGTAAVLTATVASAQNLDAGKSPPKLFADGCLSALRHVSCPFEESQAGCVVYEYGLNG